MNEYEDDVVKELEKARSLFWYYLIVFIIVLGIGIYIVSKG